MINTFTQKNVIADFNIKQKLNHKKYKSIDFSYCNQPLEDIVENKIKSKNVKNKINN